MGVLESMFGKKFPTPVLKPMGPFFVAGALIFYGVNNYSNYLANTDEFRNDPRNPRAQRGDH